MIKWLITDIDGTLLGFDHKKDGFFADPNTFETINSLLKTNKFKLSVATGRHYLNVKNLLQNYKLDFPKDGYIIGVNGAQIYSCKEDKVIKSVCFESEQIPPFKKAIDYFEKNYKDRYYVSGYQDDAHKMFFYNAESKFFKANKEEIMQFEDKANSLNPIYVKSLDELNNVHKIVFCFEPNSYDDSILIALKDMLPNTNMALSSTHDVEVFPQSVNKAIAIDYLNKHVYKYKHDEIIAFGDSFNDYEMLEYAGTSVTKISAHPEIQKICDYVIDADSSTFVGDAINLLLG